MMTAIRILGIALCLVLAFCVMQAQAGSVAALRSFDDGVTIMFVANNKPDYDGVTIINLAVPKPGTTVKSVEVQGNKQRLALCLKDTCPYRWPRTAMRSGSNDIGMLVTLSNGQTYLTTGTFGRPAQVVTSIDPTVFPPPPVITAASMPPPPPCGYLLADSGDRLTYSGGFLFAC